MKATLGHSILELVRGARIRRNVGLDRARDSRHRTAPYGRRKSDSLQEWLHIAAPLVAVNRLPDAWIAYGLAARKSVVAPSRDGDICADNRVCVHARRTECMVLLPTLCGVHR